MKKILLAGDSWGWIWNMKLGSKQGFTSATHKNRIGDLMQQGALPRLPHVSPNSFPLLYVLLTFHGFDVKQINVPGICNLEQLDYVDHELENNSYDFVIFLHTDPLRDILYSPEHTDEPRAIKEKQLHLWSKQYLLEQVAMSQRTLYADMCDSSLNTESAFLLLGANASVDQQQLASAMRVHKESKLHCVMPNILRQALLEIYHDEIELSQLAFNRISKFVDHSWNPELVNFLYDLDYSHQLSALRKLVEPDVTHMNATTAIFTVEKLLQYMEKHNLL